MNKSNQSFCNLIDIHTTFGIEVTVRTLANLRAATLAGTFHVLKDPFYKNTGYVAWASVNKESFLSMRETGISPKYPYEWKEGGLAFVTDLLYRARSKLGLRKILLDLFKQRRVVAFCRKDVVSIYRRDGEKFRLVSKKRLKSGSA